MAAPERDRPVRISVAGAGEASPEESALAEALGRSLGRAGAVVLCGGLKGVMAAVCRGSVSAGGLTIGFLPGNDAHSANPWVELPIPTGLGEGRNLLVARTGEAMVAIGGGWGTLSEVALARKLLIPVAVLGPSRFRDLKLEGFLDPDLAAEWAIRAALGRRAEREKPAAGPRD